MLTLFAGLPTLPANWQAHPPRSCCKGVRPMRSRCHARTDACTRWLPRHVGTRRRCLRAVSILLFAFGVAAFLLSAVSPEDDDVQQEFVQPKSPHYQRIKQSGKTHVTQVRGKRTLASACLLLPSVSLDRESQAYAGTAPASVAIFVSASGERSPPRS